MLLMYIQPPPRTKLSDYIISTDKAVSLNNDLTSSTVWKQHPTSAIQNHWCTKGVNTSYIAATLPKEETKTTGEKGSMPYTLQVQQPFLYKLFWIYRFSVMFRGTCWIIMSQPICSLLSAGVRKSTSLSQNQAQ